MNNKILNLNTENVLKYNPIIPNYQRIIDSSKVKEIVEYKVPYLKQEVISLINYLKDIKDGQN